MILQNLMNLRDMIQIDPDLFKDIDIPPEADKAHLLNVIYERCCRSEPLYPDTRIFKAFSDAFFSTNYRQFEKLLEIDNTDYDPLNDYGMTESEKVEGNSVIKTEGTGTTLSQHAAFNTGGFENNDKDIVESKGSNQQNGSTTIERKKIGRTGKYSMAEIVNGERMILRTDAYKIIADQYENALFYTIY